MTQLLRRAAVTVLGAAFVVLGVALMPLPGPGFLVVAAGLAVLATEYAWARRLLNRARDKAEEAQRATIASPARTTMTLLFALGMLAVGVLVLVRPEWPFTTPTAGGGLLLGGVVLLATTVVTRRQLRGRAPDRQADGYPPSPPAPRGYRCPAADLFAPTCRVSAGQCCAIAWPSDALRQGCTTSSDVRRRQVMHDGE